MGWYCHPDTITMARAQGMAKLSGYPLGTVGYARAYRDAYAEIGEEKYKGYDKYIAALDNRIAEMEGSGGDEDIDGIAVNLRAELEPER